MSRIRKRMTGEKVTEGKRVEKKRENESALSVTERKKEAKEYKSDRL